MYMYVCLCVCITEHKHPSKIPLCCRDRDELCFFLISGPADLTPPHHSAWTKALRLIDSSELSWNFISSGHSECVSEFTTHFACTNIESLVLTYGEVLEAFDVPFFHLPHSRQVESIRLRLTMSLTTYHKMYLFPHFYAYFSFPTRYRFNCSFELPASCMLPSVGDSITVSIQLSRESELYFWNVRKIKCKLGAFSLAGLKGINSLSEYKNCWGSKNVTSYIRCYIVWKMELFISHFFTDSKQYCP